MHIHLITIHDVPKIAEKLKGQRIALDTETTGLDIFGINPIAIQFGTLEDVYIVDCRGYKEADRDMWHEAIQSLLDSASEIVGMHLGYDYLVLLHFFGVRMHHMKDIMIQDLIIYGEGHSSAKMHGLPMGMQGIGGRYGVPVSKEEVDYFVDMDTRPDDWSNPFPQEQIDYMAQDIIAPLVVVSCQEERLQELDLTRVASLENAIIGLIAEVGYHGCLVDADKWALHIDDMEKEVEALADSIRERLAPFIKDALDSRIADYIESKNALLAWRANRYCFEKYAREQCKKEKKNWREWRKIYMESFDTAYPMPEKLKVPPETLGINSYQQLKEALKAYGLPINKTDKKTLKKYAKEHKVVEDILNYRILTKMLSSFGRGLLEKLGPDGRIHPQLVQIGAQTGRMSCKNPNLQQFPKDTKTGVSLRKCIIAPNGYKLLVCDFSNIEMRILAEFSQDTGMMKIFSEGGDLHCCTARMMFEIDAPDHKLEGKDLKDKDGKIIEAKEPPLEWQPKLPFRACAKTIGFGLAYGMSSKGLADTLEIVDNVARELMQKYFETFPDVRKWLDKTSNEALKQGYTTTAIGRKRFFDCSYELARKMGMSLSSLDGYLRRRAKNAPIQGTSADITKLALLLLAEYIPSGAHIIAIVHDEFVVECPDAQIEECSLAMRKAMYEAARCLLPSVHLPDMSEAYKDDVHVSSYWWKP